MNTVDDNVKLNMSLDEIIALEPQRYSHSDAERLLDSGRNDLKAFRPRLGRMERKRCHQYPSRRDDWRHYTPPSAAMTVTAGQVREDCPYLFKYNGVYVGQNSPLLNRSIGNIETIQLQSDVNKLEVMMEDDSNDQVEVEVEEDDDDEEEEEEENNSEPTFSYFQLKETEMPQRRFTDMSYVRLPVHERLGYPNANKKNEFLKSRVNFAARFLRLKKHQRKHQLTRFKSQLARLGLRTNQKQFLTKKKLKILKQKKSANPDPETQFTVSIKNDLHQPVTQASGQSNSDGVFVAPLSRQNVEQLSGRFLKPPTGSQISSISKSSENLLHERLNKVENILACSGMSMMNGYMPLSQQLGLSEASSNISLVNGVPMAKVSSIPLTLQQPVTLMVGNQVETYVPLVNTGTSMSQQGRVVRCHNDCIVVQTSNSGPSVMPLNAHLRRQLIIAASRQPLDVSVQNAISASQASINFTNNRVSRDSLNYQPTPHFTQSSINNRINRVLAKKPKKFRRQ